MVIIHLYSHIESLKAAMSAAQISEALKQTRLYPFATVCYINRPKVGDKNLPATDFQIESGIGLIYFSQTFKNPLHGFRGMAATMVKDFNRDTIIPRVPKAITPNQYLIGQWYAEFYKTEIKANSATAGPSDHS